VGTNLLKTGAAVGGMLEDPHETPGALHCAFFVKPFKLESHLQDIVFGLLRCVTLERELARHEDIQ